MDTAQLSLLRTPFNDPDFIFELKVDGFRALAYIDDGVCELVSRRRNPYKSFRELANSLRQLKVKSAIIDGELACLDSEGRSIFNELLFRRGCPIFYAFDLLYLNGRDLRQLPLIERKEKLRQIIEKSAWIFTEKRQRMTVTTYQDYVRPTMTHPPKGGRRSTCDLRISRGQRAGRHWPISLCVLATRAKKWRGLSRVQHKQI